tara:strand:- start:4014 stop:5447 length:1434 start_codon:yes stop_codon:yes gene_type:complete
MLGAVYFWGDRKGSTTILAAVVIVPVVLIFAITANLALIYLDKKNYQSRLDLAALHLVELTRVDSETVENILREDGVAVSNSGLTVLTGIYKDDLEIPLEDRFMPTEEGWNAVKLFARTDINVRVFEGQLTNSNTFEAASIAARRVVAHAWMGSRLLRVEGGLSGVLLEALLGSDARITVADYDSLLDAKLDLLTLLKGVNMSASLKAMTYSSVLESRISVGDLAAAIDSMTGTRTPSLATTLPSDIRREDITLNEIITLGDAGEYDLDLRPEEGDFLISAGELLMASLMLANGERQIDLNISALSGIANIALEVGEKGRLMQWNYDAKRTDQVQTEQVSLVVDLLGATVGARVSLAEARAEIANAQCTTSRGPDRVDVDVTTSAAEIQLLLAGRKTLKIDLSDDEVQLLSFNAVEIENGTLKTARSGLSVDVNRQPLLYRQIVRAVDDLLVSLGLNVGEVDVRIEDVNCSRPYLVR